MDNIEADEDTSLEERLEKEFDSYIPLGVSFSDKQVVIGLYFNDMFGWALSYVASFVSATSDINTAIDKFRIWYNQEGKLLIDSFRKVDYPNRERGTYTSDHISTYFRENIKLARPLFISLNKVSIQEIGKEVNTDFINMSDEEIGKLRVM